MNGNYQLTTVDGRQRYVHQLVLEPKAGFDIDHINGDKKDNHPENLRYLPRELNAIHRHNPDSGIDFMKSRGKWRLRIQRKHVGLFSTKDEARAKRLEMLEELFAPWGGLGVEDEMNNLAAVKSPDRSFGPAGQIHTLYGNVLDLANPDPAQLSMDDIAHSLAQIMRFNGHAMTPYSVLSHSMVMADLAADEFKMEALLHDTGEAYLGDIIVPVKEMFPEIGKFENTITAMIMQKFKGNHKVNCPDGAYQKSPYIASLDKRLGRAEHAVLRPIWQGEGDTEVTLKMNEYWDATPQDFIDMYTRILNSE